MKKLLMLVLALLMCTVACAENTPEAPILPVKLLEHGEAAFPLADAMTAAKKQIDKVPEQAMIRAELAEMSDGSKVWVVTIFDTATFLDAWCVTVDASTGAVITKESAAEGFFWTTYNAWTEQKGPHALWTLEDKQLYDALYAMLPSYGLPMPGDLSAEDALTKALAMLGLDAVGGYEVGYGYLMGGEGYNGVWEICLVVDGQVDCRVNLDAVTGEVYYLERNGVEPDEANG